MERCASAAFMLLTSVSVKCSSASRCHHLLKTFWNGLGGWLDRQLPDGTGIGAPAVFGSSPQERHDPGHPWLVRSVHFFDNFLVHAHQSSQALVDERVGDPEVTSDELHTGN